MVEASRTYAFANEPREARSGRTRSKYRPDSEEERVVANMMWDRRIARGNTYASQLLPSVSKKGGEGWFFFPSRVFGAGSFSSSSSISESEGKKKVMMMERWIRFIFVGPVDKKIRNREESSRNIFFSLKKNIHRLWGEKKKPLIFLSMFFFFSLSHE